MSTAAQIRANKKYNQNNTRKFTATLNKKTDADLIKKLESVDSIQGYIKELIRKDIAEEVAINAAIDEIAEENEKSY